MSDHVSLKAGGFTESVIREMTRVANRYGAVNLAQGFPDFPCPMEIKLAACEAIHADINQYAITWGSKNLRTAIAEVYGRAYGMELDTETEITVCCGSTEAMLSSLLAIVNPGDEVVVFEPFYENYGPDAILCGATPRYVALHPPEFRIDTDELRAAFSARTRAVILNSPNNPTGKVFSQSELQEIANLCIEFDAIALSDEIYEFIVYDGAKHIPIATLDGMRERTVTINSLSKSYSVTGWRVGWAIAPPEITGAIRKVHDFVTVGAAAPLQEAGAAALRLPDAYFKKLASDYGARRDRLLPSLREVGFQCFTPQGAYYIWTDISAFDAPDDVAFTYHLIQNIGVAVVPGSSFFSDPVRGRSYVRFCFCKKDVTLDAAAERLRKLKGSA